MSRYIDADAFYEHIENMPRGERYFGNIQDDLKVFPTADVEPIVHAHWIDSPNISECVVCSNCLSDNLSAQVIAPPYCIILCG